MPLNSPDRFTLVCGCVAAGLSRLIEVVCIPGAGVLAGLVPGQTDRCIVRVEARTEYNYTLLW